MKGDNKEEFAFLKAQFVIGIIQNSSLMAEMVWIWRIPGR
mgnify:FL=1